MRIVAFAAGVLALALIYGVHHFYTGAKLDRAIVAWSNSYIWDSVGSSSAPTFSDQAVKPGPIPGTWQVEGILTAAQGDGSRLHGRYVAILQKTCSVVSERRCWRLTDLKVEEQPVATADAGANLPGQAESASEAGSPEGGESILPTALIQPQPAPLPTTQPLGQDGQSTGAEAMGTGTTALGDAPTGTAQPEAQTVTPPPVIVTAMAERQAEAASLEAAAQNAAAAAQGTAQGTARQSDAQTAALGGRRLPLIPAPQGSQDASGLSPNGSTPQNGTATGEPVDPTTVLAIQQHLVTQNVYGGPLDGEMGPAMRAAIEAYQQRHGLPVDGLPSEGLLAHLDRQGGPASAGEAAATNLAGFKIVERSTGRAASGTAAEIASAAAPAAGPADAALPAADESLVFLIQDRLVALGYGKNNPLPRNGRLNPRTQKAIAAYQRKNGLPETGLPSTGLLNHIERYVKRLRAIEQGGTGAVGRAEPASAVVGVATGAQSDAASGGSGGSGYQAFRLAMSALQEGQTERAIVLFTRAIVSSDWREKHLAYFLRGNAFSGLGNLRQAVNDFSAALLLKPDYVEALVKRGITYAKLNQPDMAIADYRKGQALDPDNPMVAAAMAELAAGN